MPSSAVHTGFALLLAATAAFGRTITLESSNLALVWPAAAIHFLWAVWGLRSRRDTVIALVAAAPVLAAVTLMTGLGPALVAGVILGSAVQTLIAAHLFRRLVPGLGIRTVGDYLRLGGIALAACSVGALIIVGASALGGVASPASVFVPWIIRHAVSLTAIGSLGLVLAASISARATGATAPELRVGPLERSLIAVVSVALYMTTFGADTALPIAYIAIPVHMWAGLRLRSGWAMLHGLASGGILLFFTVAGRGPFQELDGGTAAYVAQSFMFIAFSLSAVLALSMDERQRLIAGLYRAHEEAEASAALRDLVISRMHDGVLVAGADRRPIFQNEMSARWLGSCITRPAELWRRDYDVTTVNGEPLTDADDPLTLALQGVVTERLDLDLTHPDGHVVYLSVDAIPLPDEHGAVVVTRDVTDERMYQRDLGRFASVVAHDLMTPLTVFDGWLEMLEDPELPVAQQQASVARLQQASLRMRNLIRNLLVYSLAKEERLAPMHLDVTETVEGIIDLRTALRGKDVPLVRFHVQTAHPVYADERMFLQLVENLVGNALKYGRTDGTAEITIATSMDDASGRTLISIRDNGIGIPEADLERVFDDFHRAENGLGHAAGTGLGLAICRRIAESHGGSISVANVPGGGAEFTVSLPAGPDQLPAGVAQADADEDSMAPAY
ncbi:ATP-binding protein [uncultured Arthrobacter sp.]|uniref:sensor histidine kinase n=1 Tax=uncultured Arthrobacter sp. TaxID=114050 RepID=UPI00262F0354|nr:ATP-binding protein [uncultured Arthrobacter sp.]